MFTLVSLQSSRHRNLDWYKLNVLWIRLEVKLDIHQFGAVDLLTPNNSCRYDCITPWKVYASFVFKETVSILSTIK